jgi:hypothetical protein
VQANESRQRAEQDIKAAEKALADRDREIGELRREITALRQQDQQRIAELASAVSALGKKTRFKQRQTLSTTKESIKRKAS